MSANMSATDPSRTRRVSSAEAKNRFGSLLEAAVAGERVEITRYGEVRAVMVSVEDFEALSRQPARELNRLTAEFDRMLADMQSDATRSALVAAFDASPEDMGRAAVALALRADPSPTRG